MYFREEKAVAEILVAALQLYHWRTVMKLRFMLPLLIAPALLAQQPAKPKPTVDITVKSSPAEDALVKAAKDVATKQQAYDAMLQQARGTLESNQSAIAKKLTDAQNDLNTKLKADKKYKPIVDNIIALENQLSDASKTVQNSFNQESGTLQQSINTDRALIKGLVPVVRQENGLPDTADFNANTQKWTK